MSLNRNIYTGLAVLLLFTLFPAIIVNSGDGNAGYNTMTDTDPINKTKVNSIQALLYHDPIAITDNSEFTAAGFTGSGIPGNPYILKDYFINGSGDSGIVIFDSDAEFIIENVHVNGSDGEGTPGIVLYNVQNGIFTDCSVTNSTFGFIMVFNSFNNTLMNNNATGNSEGDYILAFSNNNTLSYNNATGADIGFFLGGSNNNTLIGNNATDNIDGFDLHDHCNDNLLVDNYVAGCTHGYNLTLDSNFNNLTGNTAVGISNNGFYLEDSHNNTLVNNNASDNTGGSSAGFDLNGSNNNTLIDNTAGNGNFRGFDLESSSGNILIGNTANGMRYGRGFYLWSSSNYNVLIENTANNNTYGFHITTGSNFNTFIDNNAHYNKQSTPNGANEGGFLIQNSNNNTFTGNNASENDQGFYMDGSHDNNITSNIISGNTRYGCLLHNSDSNIIAWNTIAGSTFWGIYIMGSSDNVVFYNYFIDNWLSSGPQASDDSLNNYWTNGTHGNYWNDYTGIDSGNGIGNINYTLDGGQQVNDTKPLVSGLQVTGPGSHIYESQPGTLTLSWMPVSMLPGAGYELYIDYGLTDSGTWQPGVAIEVDVDLMSLLMNTLYNYTLVVSDINKTVVDTALVSTLDNTDPEITAPEDFTVEAGQTTAILTFTMTDLYPDSYILYLDGAVNDTFTWTSGSDVTIPLNGFSPGEYNFTLVVTDTTGNEAVEEVIVTVADNTAPVIGYTGSDTITYEIGTISGLSLNFTISDYFPGNLTLYHNGDVTYFNSSWVPGEFSCIGDIGLPVGTHNFTLMIRDTSGNEAVKTVIITVTEQPASSTTTTTTTSTPTSSSSTTATTSTTSDTTPIPGWTTPIVILSLLVAAITGTRYKKRRKNN